MLSPRPRRGETKSLRSLPMGALVATPSLLSESSSTSTSSVPPIADQSSMTADSGHFSDFRAKTPGSRLWGRHQRPSRHRWGRVRSRVLPRATGRRRGGARSRLHLRAPSHSGEGPGRRPTPTPAGGRCCALLTTIPTQSLDRRSRDGRPGGPARRCGRPEAGCVRRRTVGLRGSRRSPTPPPQSPPAPWPTYRSRAPT